jgi:predicted RNase H-like nuclease (RuvC/YqgF family)
LGQEDQRRRDQLMTTRAALSEITELNKTIAKTRRDLRESVQMLKERIGAVRGKIESTEKQTEQAREVIAEQKKKREELEGRLAKLKSAADSLNGTIATLETRTRSLLKRVPAHVREDQLISTLSQGIPKDPNQTERSLSQRFQNVVGILNKLNELSGEILIVPEIRNLPDGSKAQVRTVYLGFGQAYYLGGNGTIAGVGNVGADGTWTWKPANDAAPAIAEVLSILDDEKPAAFVQVPIEIK